MAKHIMIQQEIDFANEIAQTDLLTRALDWITNDLDPDQVFEESVLECWALDNGFKKSRAKKKSE